MKHIHHYFLRFVIVAGVSLFLVSSPGCKKNDPNVLTGDTNIQLTQKDSVTNVYFTVNGTSLPGTTVKIISNSNGMVTYGATTDLSAYPDSIKTALATMVPQLITYYNPQNVTFNISGTTLTIQFTIKVTSEGMQNYFVDGQPWTVKYADGVGTNYTVKRTNGDILTATVTEKTGADDWPYGFYYIKTSKVEYNAPVDDPVLSKVTFRVNHKFGLVYLKAEGKNGKVLELSLFPYYVM
ncbi:MAG: hypothetical protein JST90_08505 [Bacteroidetes bacterium]|nr:hypothetical protein [Bacteroidota bacterium]